MGAELMTLPAFKASVRLQDNILQQISDAPNWRLEDILSGNSSADIHAANISQTACTALQVAIVDLFRTWNVTPRACVGHSSGEIAAAYGSGNITLAEAIVVAYYRGCAIARNSREGAMLAIGMSYELATELISGIEKEVKIAAINSPSSVTLSGDTERIKQLEEDLKEKNVFARVLTYWVRVHHRSWYMTGQVLYKFWKYRCNSLPNPSIMLLYIPNL